jgi:rSAM/selenodomain-associated transferase 2
MGISLIVPVLNEEKILRNFLGHLREVVPECEIVVADGGSSDATFKIARELADKAVQSSSGRGAQMNAGARLASGDVLWFVHVDSIVAGSSVRAIEQALANPTIVGGCFRLRIDSPRWIFRLRDAIGNGLVALNGVPLGDRGFFCRRAAFVSINGYPEIPLLEDAEFYLKLRKRGRVRQLHETIRTSARRYEALGPLATVCFYGFIMTLYVLRIPRPLLEKMVRRYVVRARDRPSA